MRVRSLVALGAAVAVMVSACSSAGSPSAAPASPTQSGGQSLAPDGALAGKKVAWVMRGFDGYQQADSASFKAAAEADGLDVTLINGKDDPLLQAKAIDDLIAAKVDGIVWQPVDPAAAVEPAKRIRAAGIPLVFVEHSPEAGPDVPKAPFVPGDDMKDLTYKAGADAAKFVIDTLKKTPKVVNFDWVQIQQCHEDRMVSFMDGVKSVAPDAETVFWDTVPANKDQTMAKMEDQLQANPDFNIFTGCGGDLILGGVAGLQAAGRAKAVDGVPQTEWILTIDGTPEEIRLLLDKTSAVQQTIMQRPFEHGIEIWNTLKRVITGDLAPDAEDSGVHTTSITLYKTMSCQEIVAEYQKQYGKTEIYKPVDCGQ